MLKEWYNKYKLAEFIFMIFLALNFFNNNSYAMSFDEFYYYVQDHYNAEYDNLSYDLKSYLGKWLTYANKNTMRNYWQDNNAIIMDFGLTPNSNSKTVYLYFINNNNNLTFGRTITGVGSFKRMGFDVYNSKNQVNIYSSSSYNGNITLSNTTTFVSNTKTNRNAFIVQEKQKQSATNEYWFTDILTRYNFVFLNNYIDYNNKYKIIGYLDGQDLNTHKFEAILYSDYGTSFENVVGRVNPYQNVRDNMYIPMYDSNHIYVSVLSRLLVPNKEYYLRVLYDNDYDFEDNIYFTFQTDVSGNIINGDYNIQNSTNDIIQNQNQNTQELVNAIESGDKEQQNFIEQKVNEIFGVNSGDLNESLDKFIESINLPSGELEIDKSILGIITQNAGDFVISWQTVETPFLTISGDSINFSALCRSNEDLAKLKEWLNIILSLFCFGALLTNLWNSLLLTLGISTYIYEKQSAELEKTAKQEARKQIKIEKEHEKGYQAFKRRNGK